MSVMDYVVLYHTNGMTSTHPLSSWGQVRAFYADQTSGRMITIPDAFGGETCLFREELSSIHLISEAQIANNSQRRAAILKSDAEAEEEWK